MNVRRPLPGRVTRRAQAPASSSVTNCRTATPAAVGQDSTSTPIYHPDVLVSNSTILNVNLVCVMMLQDGHVYNIFYAFPLVGCGIQNNHPVNWL